MSVYRTRGIHVGEYHGLPATGNELVTTAVNHFRIDAGRITELQVFTDRGELLRQLTGP